MLVLLHSTEDSSSGVGFLLFYLMASLGHWVMMAVETCMSVFPPPPPPLWSLKGIGSWRVPRGVLYLSLVSDLQYQRYVRATM